METHSLVQLWAVAQQLLPPAYLHKAAEVVGWLAMLGYAGPKLLAWGVPAAMRAADAVAQVVTKYVPAPILAYVLPWVVKFLDDVVGAMTQILTTFKNRLEADLQKAAQAAAPAPAVPAVDPPPGGQP